MLTLLRVVSLRYYRANLLRTAITVLGVTLGVAVLAAIRITNVSTLRAFERSVEAIAGRARLQVMSDGGSFDERLLPIARRQPGVAAAAPVVEARMLAAGTVVEGAGRSTGRLRARARRGALEEDRHPPELT